jgi:phytoene/squalene synthetase
LRILNCYYEDMRYHAKITDVSGINAVTNGTPSFDSEEDLEAYLERVAYTIGEFIEEACSMDDSFYPYFDEAEVEEAGDE